MAPFCSAGCSVGGGSVGGSRPPSSATLMPSPSSPARLLASSELAGRLPLHLLTRPYPPPSPPLQRRQHQRQHGCAQAGGGV